MREDTVFRRFYMCLCINKNEELPWQMKYMESRKSHLRSTVKC